MKRIVLITILFAGGVSAQYSSWNYSASIDINLTPLGADLPASVSDTNFPVLIKLGSGYFDFSQAKADGSD